MSRHQETLPVMIAELSLRPLAPVDCDGGFLYDPDNALEEYHNKAYLLTTPACEETGVPLVIHPECGQGHDIRPADDHHPEHPRLHSSLADLGGLAVRHSRVQKTNYWVHHLCVHETFRGPELPVTPKEQFRRALYNEAGLIPEKVLYFRGPGDYTLVPLPKKMREKLWQNNTIHVERSVIVSEFIKRYLFDVSLLTTSNKEVGKLLVATDPIKRWEQAKRILSVAAVEATKDFSETFKSMYDRGLLPPVPVPAASIGTWRAHKLVMSNLGNRDNKKTSAVVGLQTFFAGRDGETALPRVA